MATTQWLDPGGGWTMADWEDATQNVLMSHIGGSLKGAADERVAFSANVHDSSFAASETFPDFSLFVANENSPNNATRIVNSIYPIAAVKTDSIETSGTVTSGDIPETMTLSELLTGPLGYASGTLLHMTDTTNGTQSGLAKSEWFKQWFRVMEYPEYYNRLIRTTGTNEGPEVTNVQWQFCRAELDYSYDNNTSTFISATMEVRSPQPTSTPTDVYVTNDLNETAPFSTVTQCRDYCITSFDNELANDNWQGVGTGDLTAKEIYTEIKYTLEYGTVGGGNPDQIEINIDIKNQRLRFRVSDAYRALSPGRYIVPVKWNGYYRKDTASLTCPTSGYPGGTFTCNSNWDDFGTGETENEIVFVTLTADGSNDYYLEVVAPDYTSPTVPTLPVQGDGLIDKFSCWRYSLTADMATITTIYNSVYFHANTTDGNNFLYYTPAP